MRKKLTDVSLLLFKPNMYTKEYEQGSAGYKNQCNQQRCKHRLKHHCPGFHLCRRRHRYLFPRVLFFRHMFRNPRLSVHRDKPKCHKVRFNPAHVGNLPAVIIVVLFLFHTLPLPRCHRNTTAARVIKTLIVQMTNYKVSGLYFFFNRRSSFTYFHTFRATGMKFAALRRICRRWN